MLAGPRNDMFRASCLELVVGLMSVLCTAQSPPTPATTSPTAVGAHPAPSTAPAPATALPANTLGEARTFYRKGNFAAAIPKYQEYLKDHPGLPDGYTGLVRVYLKQKNVDLAAQTAEQGLAHSDSARMHTAHAEVLFRQGKIPEAEAEWVKVINSGYPEAHAYLGVARVRNALANYKSAKTLLDRAHELAPDDPDIAEEWIDTLSRAERISYLEKSLAGDNNWDADERSDIMNYLQYLKERARQKNSSPCRLVSKIDSTETPLVRLLSDPQHLRGYGLNVGLNGHKSSLLLDTGANGILVRRAVAERAGVAKISETKVWGIGNKGRRNAFVGVVHSIKVGELEFQDCPIEVIDSRSVADEDGLIGADVFESFLVDIDFPNEKLKLSQLPVRPGESQKEVALKSEDDDSSDDDSADNDTANNGSAEKKIDSKSAPANSSAAKPGASQPASAGPFDSYTAPEMKSYTRVFLFGHDLLIPTSIGKVPQKFFLLDTGSLTNFISPQAAGEVTKVHDDSDTIVKGISGKVDKVYSANKAVLTFGRLRQENQDITAFDTKPISDSVGTEVSGFLGFTTLRMLDIKIDYRDALVDFQYDAKRFGR
jgi:predicted aspartyl protease/Tfp pilus assembly protein PilF